MDTLKTNIDALTKYLTWEKGDYCLAFNSENKKDVENSIYSKKAKTMGEKI